MAIELKMPALSPTMEKGTLARWLVSEGDRVAAGDLIAEIETDKATMELEADQGGQIARLVVNAGTDDVAVGTVIALLADGAGVTPAAPLAGSVHEMERSVPAIAASVPPTPGTVIAAAVGAAASQVSAPIRRSPADRIRVSPLAQRIADARGIDLSAITGSGPNGRIVRADLGLQPLALAARMKEPVLVRSVTAAPGQPVTAPLMPPPAGVPLTTEKLSSMRRTIARRLTESKQTVPHFYLTARCNLDPLLALRNQLNTAIADQGTKISVNDMLMKAMALAFRQVPAANVQFGGEELHRFERVDISMAVAIDGGLITPVIRDVGAMSLSTIGIRSKELAAKARAGKLLPEDYQGGTASISNLGMFGIDEMFPVINPPQAMILGIAAGRRQPWEVDGQLELATVMAATASFDHRAIDGAVAAEFMAAFRNSVENPLLIIT